MKIILTLDFEAGTIAELDRNHSGTSPEPVSGQVVPAGGKAPLKGASPTDQPPVPAANLYGLTDPELLDCLGPSWAAMSHTERRDYGPSGTRHWRRTAA